MHINIQRSCEVERTGRLLQLNGLFDLNASSQKSLQLWDFDLNLPDKWQIGSVVGPSGAGKSTILGEVFGYKPLTQKWSDTKSLVDDFPKSMSVKEIVELLSSVGFSSPPSWCKPFKVLSNGEQFRCMLARLMADSSGLVIVDEYSSVVDRNVARIGSNALQRAIRRRPDRQLIVGSCHYDILDWLQPDWILEPHIGKLTSFTEDRRLRRPKIDLTITRCSRSAWQLFRQHHYLDTHIHRAAQCFVATWNNVPVAFTAILHFPHPRHPNTKREHRTVCLPDYQGIGIGNAMSDTMASMCKGLGCRYLSITSHPAMIGSRMRSGNWKCIAKPNMSSKTIPKGVRHGLTSGLGGKIALRLRATFEYTGTAMEKEQAWKLWNS